MWTTGVFFFFFGGSAGNGFETLNGSLFRVAIVEVEADAVPHQVIEREWLIEFEILVPRSGFGDDFSVVLRVAEDLIFGVNDFHGQLTLAWMGVAEGNGDVQSASGVGGDGFRCAACGLKRLHR